MISNATRELSCNYRENWKCFLGATAELSINESCVGTSISFPRVKMKLSYTKYIVPSAIGKRNTICVWMRIYFDTKLFFPFPRMKWNIIEIQWWMVSNLYLEINAAGQFPFFRRGNVENEACTTCCYYYLQRTILRHSYSQRLKFLVT